MKYEDIKSKLKFIFPNESETSCNEFQELNIKSGLAFSIQNEPHKGSENESEAFFEK